MDGDACGADSLVRRRGGMWYLCGTMTSHLFERTRSQTYVGCLGNGCCDGEYIYNDSKRSDVEKRAFHLFGLRASETYRMMNSSTNGRCYGEYIHDDSKLSNTSPTP
jgi:hypothetical protein